MRTQECELVEEFSCDELCMLESRRKPLGKDMKNAIRKRIYENECRCEIF